MEEERNSPGPETPSPPREAVQAESSPLSDEIGKRSGSGEKGSGEKGSNEKLSRSKMQYETDPEDMELRKKLLESKMARKKTEEDAKVLMNRLMLLKTEEQKVS